MTWSPLADALHVCILICQCMRHLLCYISSMAEGSSRHYMIMYDHVQVGVGSLTGVGHSIGHHEYEFNHFPAPQARVSLQPCINDPIQLQGSIRGTPPCPPLQKIWAITAITCCCDPLDTCQSGARTPALSRVIAGIQVDLWGHHGLADCPCFCPLCDGCDGKAGPSDQQPSNCCRKQFA